MIVKIDVDNVHNIIYTSIMKPIRFNKDKDKQLKISRKIGFSEIIKAITKREVIATIDNPNKEKYPTQKIYLVQIRNYIYLVPFFEENEYFFLKTIIPSRKQTRKYLKSYKLINKNEKTTK